MTKTRFAPSPTGLLHIGGARTALFSWLYARQHGGRFVLRIEDTDRERSTQESVNAILEAMTWLGLNYEEGPFYQTRRMDRYREVLQQLLDSDQAYYCYCTPKELEQRREEQLARKEKPRYDHTHRDYQGPAIEGISPVIRFKNPLDGDVIIDDMIHGKIVIRNEELDDLIIARADGTPTYNFCVVVDDMDMAVTHVIRGDDHINNTPRQINILKALDAPLPHYAHMPMILGSDGKRLSKRHGAVNVMQYRDQGFLPEALLNYLARLGWSHGDQEIFSLDEMIQSFDIHQVNRAAARLDPEKLLWLNQHYIQNADSNHLARHLSWQINRAGIDPTTDGPDLPRVAEVFRNRCKTLEEMCQAAMFCYRDFEEYNPTAAKKHLKPQSLPILQHLAESLSAMNESHWTEESLQELLTRTTEALEIKFGKMAQPVRVAITGDAVSPSLNTTLALLGKEKTLKRIHRAIDWLKNKNND